MQKIYKEMGNTFVQSHINIYVNSQPTSVAIPETTVNGVKTDVFYADGQVRPEHGKNRVQVWLTFKGDPVLKIGYLAKESMYNKLITHDVPVEIMVWVQNTEIEPQFKFMVLEPIEYDA